MISLRNYFFSNLLLSEISLTRSAGTLGTQVVVEVALITLSGRLAGNILYPLIK
jgi:hypothetical protein